MTGYRNFGPRNFRADFSPSRSHPYNFLKVSAKKKFLFRDIEFSSKLDFSDVSIAGDYFLDIQYLDKRTFFLAEAFKIFEGH